MKKKLSVQAFEKICSDGGTTLSRLELDNNEKEKVEIPQNSP